MPGITSLEEEVNSKIRQTDDLLIPAINRALCRAAGKYVLWGNEYMPESPVEGAQQCIEDVRKHFTPAESHLEWKFNRAEGITYDMLMQLVEI